MSNSSLPLLSATLLSATLLMYAPASQADSKANSLFDLDIVDLLAVRVEAPGKREQSPDDSTATVTVISADDIATYGANSLFEVLDRVAGVQMLGSFFYPQNLAVIRGVQLTHANNEVLLLLNGRPMREAFTGGDKFAIYTAFPLSIIKQIEVIRGPGSVLYGSNAFTGVINIVTNDHGQASKNSLRVTLGSFDSKDVDASWNKAGSDWSLTLGAKYFKEDGWDFNAKDNSGVDGTFNTAEKNYAVEANGYKGNWRLSALLANSDQNFWGSTSSWAGIPQNERVITSERRMIDLGYHQKLSEQDYIDYNLSHTHSRLAQYTYEVTSNNWFAEAALHQQFTDHGYWLSGATIWHQQLDSYPGTSAAPIPSFSRNWYTAYTEYQSANVTFNWTLGVQVNKVPKVKANLVPRLGLQWKLDENAGFKFQYAEAFRAAYGIETDFHIVICCDENGENRGGLRGNPGLEAEQIATYELQYYLTKKSSRYTATLFASELSNLIERERKPDHVLEFINKGKLSSHGVELEARHAFNKQTQIQASYTYQQNHNNSIDDFTLMPNSSLKVGVQHSTEQRWQLGVFLQWLSPFHDNSIRNPASQAFNPPSESYALLSANVRIPLLKEKQRNSELALRCNNLLNEKVYQPEIAGRQINTQPMITDASCYVSYQLNF